MQTHKESRNRERQAMREANELPRSSIVDVDPEDPSQLLDEVGQFSVVQLAVEAQPSAEAEADIEAATAEAHYEDESEVDEDAQELDTPDATTADAYAEAAEDTGDAYGVHSPRAADKDLDKTADGAQLADSEDGENWLETLGKKATEYGAEPEAELDVVDDSDQHRGHHSSDRRDRPVADKGSGGDGGL